MQRCGTRVIEGSGDSPGGSRSLSLRRPLARSLYVPPPPAPAAGVAAMTSRALNSECCAGVGSPLSRASVCVRTLFCTSLVSAIVELNFIPFRNTSV